MLDFGTTPWHFVHGIQACKCCEKYFKIHWNDVNWLTIKPQIRLVALSFLWPPPPHPVPMLPNWVCWRCCPTIATSPTTAVGELGTNNRIRETWEPEQLNCKELCYTETKLMNLLFPITLSFLTPWFSLMWVKKHEKKLKLGQQW